MLDGDRRGPRLVEPAGLAIDAFGRFVVSDAAAHRVLRYDKDGSWLGQEGALGSDPGQLRRPTAVATLGSLGVAVLDSENRRVISYDLQGRRIGVLVDLKAAALLAVTGRIDAITLAADRGGALFVADAARDRILVFDFSGRFLRELGGYGTRSGAFRGLSGLATTPRGELAACERGGRRVQQLDAGGRVVRSWPLPVAPGRAPLAVAADDSARVAVADGVSGGLWIFDRLGRLWAARYDLDEPRALAFAPDGTLLVVEAATGRVRRFSLDSATDPAAPVGD
ncbi:MAG: NHL repeat-containing protein [Candidatus Eisenbacteria bacterium]